MKRLLIASAAFLAVMAAAVPAVVGLAGNPSFSHKLPVRAPSQAQLVKYDDNGHAVGTVSPTRSSTGSTASKTPAPKATAATTTAPSPVVPQQLHLDIMVEDVAVATPHVLALGAEKLDGDGVFADPAGHPFCLITRPGWAPVIPD